MRGARCQTVQDAKIQKDGMLIWREGGAQCAAKNRNGKKPHGDMMTTEWNAAVQSGY